MTAAASAVAALAPIAVSPDGSASALEIIEGCIDWNAQQGCVVYQFCLVGSNVNWYWCTTW